jgi:basic amino acid/polyamine antiporter, APA family
VGSWSVPLPPQALFETHLDVGDLERSITFYRDVVGLLTVVHVGAPNFPIWVFGIITMFAVANTGLLNMLMASRLVYGMSRQHVLPDVLGRVHPARRTPYVAIGFTTLLAVVLITFVGEIPALAGTTTLLLLGVFTVVNIGVIVLRRDGVIERQVDIGD